MTDSNQKRIVDLMREHAADLKLCHCVGDDWRSEHDAKAAHDELLELAQWLQQSSDARDQPVMKYTNSATGYHIEWETLPYGTHLLYAHPAPAQQRTLPASFRDKEDLAAWLESLNECVAGTNSVTDRPWPPARLAAAALRGNGANDQQPAVLIQEAVRDLLSGVRTVNRAPQHLVDVEGDDEPCYYQRAEWIKWILGLADKAEHAISAAQQPLCGQTQPLIARPLAEWHEEDGPVTWWAWCGQGWAGESAWCGTPLDSDWPGYHTHWTPHPTMPSAQQPVTRLPDGMPRDAKEAACTQCGKLTTAHSIESHRCWDCVHGSDAQHVTVPAALAEWASNPAHQGTEWRRGYEAARGFVASQLAQAADGEGSADA